MRVLFVYPNSTRSPDFPLGIGYLSAMLKQHGYKTGLLDLTWNPNYETIIKTMRGYDLLAISCGTLEYRMSLSIARIWKQHFELPVIMGGPKPTTEPEQTLDNPNIDAVCRGEGEHALLELVQLYEQNGVLPTTVKNFWVKKDGKIHQNPLRPLVENLDTLPFPDRSLFDRKRMENKYPGCAFITSRGCPFSCKMCINHYLQRLYKNLGKYTRFRSVTNLLQEITEVNQTYKLKLIMFADDTFTVNHKRLKEFCKRYPRKVDLPFIIMARCNTVTKKLLLKLRHAGCIHIAYGLEAGNNFIRNTVLNRGMTDTQIIQALKWTREVGIKTVTFNMIGIPFEDRKKIFETVNLNRQIKPDLVQTTLLYPFPKTEIEQIARQNGMLREANPSSLTDYYSGSIIKLPLMTTQDLHSLSVMMPFYIRMPHLFYPLIRLAEAALTLLASTVLNKVFRKALRFFTRKILQRNFWKQIRK